MAALRALPPGELARKLVHMGVGGIAFALRVLGPLGSVACAAGAVLFNVAVLPRIGGKRLWRDAEAGRGQALGIVLYPVTVLLLVLLFWRRLEVAAAAWGILAFGDGMASLAGMTLGTRRLPWNPRKSWAGTLAYVLFGALGAGILLQWTAPGRYGVAFAWLVTLAAALFAAALESLPEGLDDNLGVPLVSALLLGALLLTEGRWESWLADPALPRRLLAGVGINAVLAAAGYASRGVNRSGMIGGFLVGTLIYACLDWPGYLLLLAFFVLGTGATKLGYARKARERIAQEEGGRRGAKHALAKTAVAAACALFAVTTPLPELFRLAFAAAFATAASDTAASEIGKLWGRRTYLITSFRPVPRGTDGAVSLEGTLAGIAASFLVAGLGIATGLLGPAAWWILPLSALVATTLESLVGATLERRGLLGNEAVNFLNTLAGALVAFALGAVG